MRSSVHLLVLTLGAACLHGQLREGSDSLAGNIRTDLVLKVGGAEISHYAVEKNLSRFLRAGNGGSRPPPEALRAWFELFLARQVAIAEAIGQGYAQRPEVVHMVDTMERHMLAQTEPATSPPTETELRAAYDRLTEPPGGAKPVFAEQRPLLEKRLQQERRFAARQAQRAQAVQATGLDINRATVERLFQRIQAESPRTADISEGLTVPLTGELLASYRLDDQPLILTVAGWRERFNALFVRELPATAAQLEAGVRDLVVAEYTAREARRRGLDREPRFVEDRRNFVYAQALALFEKEKLLPQVETAPADVETYYRDHQAEFSRPVRARGKLLHFASPAAAQAWMRTAAEGEVSRSETVEVSHATPLAADPKATELILHAEEGRRRADSRNARRADFYQAGHGNRTRAVCGGRRDDPRAAGPREARAP